MVVLKINDYSAMIGGAAPVTPRPRSARGGAVCFSWYSFDFAPAIASAVGIFFFDV